MSKSKDLARITELESLIKHHDELYYGQSTQEISDHEYDKLVVELRSLVESNNLSSELYSKPGHSTKAKVYEDVKHVRPMISLRTEVNTSDKPIKDFIRRIREEGYTGDLVLEPKYDGVALSLRWKDSALQNAILRGDGESGEDIYTNAIQIPSIPTQLDPELSTVDEIRGEVVLPKASLKLVNDIRVSQGKNAFINCRNAVSGILRARESGVELLRHLVFKPYSVFGLNGVETHGESLYKLSRQFAVEAPKLSTDSEYTYGYYQEISMSRGSFPYDIDGVVYKVNELHWQDKLGSINREPRWAIAHKFIPEQAVTTLLAIQADVGQTGRITPVAIVEPVFVGGVTVSNITLSNIFQIRRKGVRIGDKIVIRRAGDVIPEIVGVCPDNIRKNYIPNWAIPKECPTCGTDSIRPKGQANYICPNSDCESQLAGKFTHIAQRGILDIQGLGPSVSEALVQNGYTKISQLLSLTEQQIVETGIGGANSRKLAKEISSVRAKPISMDKAIRALAISNIGEGASAKITKYYHTPEMLLNWRKETIESIPELNKTEKANLIKYLESNLQEAKDIFSQLTITESKKYEGSLSGMTVVFTGSDPKFSKQDLKEIAEQNGAAISSSVSKTTSLVVYGFNAGDKLNKATKYGVSTMSSQNFVAKYGS